MLSDQHSSGTVSIGGAPA